MFIIIFAYSLDELIAKIMYHRLFKLTEESSSMSLSKSDLIIDFCIETIY